VTELRARPHHVRPGATVIEVWHDGQFVATVTAASADGPGVTVISKYPLAATVTEHGPLAEATILIGGR
jgi:hypothetical protein